MAEGQHSGGKLIIVALSESALKGMGLRQERTRDGSALGLPAACHPIGTSFATGEVHFGLDGAGTNGAGPRSRRLLHPRAQADLRGLGYGSFPPAQLGSSEARIRA
jgi:hypothetical protein